MGEGRECCRWLRAPAYAGPSPSAAPDTRTAWLLMARRGCSCCCCACASRAACSHGRAPSSKTVRHMLDGHTHCTCLLAHIRETHLVHPDDQLGAFAADPHPAIRSIPSPSSPSSKPLLTKTLIFYKKRRSLQLRPPNRQQSETQFTPSTRHQLYFVLDKSQYLE